ncbi:ArsC family reductase [Noviherbaspirillum massiliense]|uniref:ArsC family reductase n=1 Tax=Noviherbaspirillum massiliense TaxID=1465823 RepID=UPI0002F36CA3|nr:ArsC family reductase [Noviherbaspirillum massiliense]
MTTTLYGIPNCDQVRKARTWLDEKGIAYHFHDFKKAGLSRELVDTWLGEVEWETLVNRRGTTWRALSEERKASVTDAESAAVLMLESPSIVKRPVLSSGGKIHVGFSDALYQQIFKN